MGEKNRGFSKAEKPLRIFQVLLVDDHPIVRHGLAQLINQQEDLKVWREVDGGQEALAVLEKGLPDIALVDISLKDMTGLDLIKQILARHKDLPILVLSMHDENLYAQRALLAGARGYIMKDKATEKLFEAIRKILGGETFLSQEMAMNMAFQKRSNKEEDPLLRLTDRELEVLQMIGEGLGTRQIAEKLYLSIKTIETYRAKVKEKLNLKTSSEMVQYAVQFVQKKQG